MRLHPWPPRTVVSVLPTPHCARDAPSGARDPGCRSHSRQSPPGARRPALTGGYESGPRPVPASVTRRSAAIWWMASGWLPAVPAAPWTARARAGEEEAQQPQDEHDQGDPPQHVHRETQPAQYEGEQEDSKDDCHHRFPSRYGRPLTHHCGVHQTGCPGLLPRHRALRRRGPAPDPYRCQFVGAASGRCQPRTSCPPGRRRPFRTAAPAGGDCLNAVVRGRWWLPEGRHSWSCLPGRRSRCDSEQPCSWYG